MAFQVCQFFLLIALLLSSFDGITKSQATKPSKHGEVHRAKSEIDSLIYKLTLDLKSLNEKETKADAMQKDAAKLTRVAKKEIALLVSSTSFGKALQGEHFEISVLYGLVRR